MRYKDFEYDGQTSGFLFNKVPNGFGKAYYSDGGRYEGEWVDGLRHGQGRFIVSDGTIYIATFKDNFPDGPGEIRYAKGSILKGNFDHGWHMPKGTLRYKNGSTYVGPLKKNRPHGMGKLTYSDGDYYVGEFVEGKRQGKGTLYVPNDKYIECYYTDYWIPDIPTKPVMIFYRNGVKVYGYLDENWTITGQGIAEYPDGAKYEGQMKRSLRHGYGKITFRDGSIQEGLYKEDQYIGK